MSNGESCQQERGHSEILNCSFGIREGEQEIDIALVGDSHAAVWSSAMDAIAAREKARVTTYLAAGCAALDDPTITFAFDTNQTHIDACKKWRADVVAEIAGSDVDVIVTTSVDKFYSKESDRAARDTGDGYVRAWTRWLDAGKTVIVINTVPIFEKHIPECVALAAHEVDPCSMTRDPAVRIGPLANAAEQIDHPEFSFVDHWDVFCDGSHCSSVIGGIPAYIDSNHLTAAFARSFDNRFIPEAPFASLR